MVERMPRVSVAKWYISIYYVAAAAAPARKFNLCESIIT